MARMSAESGMRRVSMTSTPMHQPSSRRSIEITLSGWRPVQTPTSSAARRAILTMEAPCPFSPLPETLDVSSSAPARSLPLAVASSRTTALSVAAPAGAAWPSSGASSFDGGEAPPFAAFAGSSLGREVRLRRGVTPPPVSLTATPPSPRVEFAG